MGSLGGAGAGGSQGAMDRINALTSIEKDLHGMLQSAGQVLQELSKDKQSQKNVDNHANMFLKTLNTIEQELSKQISYLTQVSTGQPHEGSIYGSKKVLQMAWHRLEHVKARISEIEKVRGEHLASFGGSGISNTSLNSSMSMPTPGPPSQAGGPGSVPPGLGS